MRLAETLCPPLAMLLTNKDLNLNPVSTLSHSGPTTFYRAPLHHNQSDGFEPISHRLISPMICSYNGSRTRYVDKPHLSDSQAHQPLCAVAIFILNKDSYYVFNNQIYFCFSSYKLMKFFP